MRWQTSTRTKAALSGFVFLLLACNRNVAEGKSSGLDVMTAALIGQFETIFHTNANLLASAGDDKRLAAQSASALRLPFSPLLGGLESLGGPVRAELLGKADAVLIGAKDFHPPSALGDVQSHFCYVLVLAQNDTSILNKTIGKSPKARKTEGSLWTWSAGPTEGSQATVQFYATELNGSYLLISNSPGDLGKLTQRVTSSGERFTSVSSNVHNWEDIVRHEIWGYRHYNHDEPFNREAAGTSQVTPGADALAFYVDINKQTGVIWLFSRTSDTPEKINAKHMLPPLKKIKKGLWESKVFLVGGDAVTQPLVNLMGLFGFAIYL